LSLGVGWLTKVPLAHAHALLVATARLVAPGYESDADGELVADYERRVKRGVTRAQKQKLTALGPLLAEQAFPASKAASLMAAVAQTEHRVAFLASGDLLATLDGLRASDRAFFDATTSADERALAALWRHPVGGDLCRFALGAEATALRRALGTVWDTGE
jgi:hypothetical protein